MVVSVCMKYWPEVRHIPSSIPTTTLGFRELKCTRSLKVWMALAEGLESMALCYIYRVASMFGCLENSNISTTFVQRPHWPTSAVHF